MPANFFDTNVLVYIASADTAKADRAEAALAAGGAISVEGGHRIICLSSEDATAAV